jgi:hypothetical protein
MKYTVRIPKILYLSLLISKYAKDSMYYNTNDLIKWANEMKPDLVRTRKDKDEYKFLDDTNFGGLRGNFSTLLTFRGILKKNNTYTTYYGVGKNDRLFNAYKKGEIILDSHEYYAYTYNENLKKLLENEARGLTIREEQAHIKVFLKNSEDLGIYRDNENFKKIAVVKSLNNQYFLRILFNTFVNDNIIEYNMYNYLSGTKIKQYNIHPLFVIPSNEKSWDKIFVMDAKDILKNAPLFIYYDKTKDKFYDSKENVYNHYTLEEGLNILSDQNGNIDERLLYNWDEVKDNYIQDRVIESFNNSTDEFYVFLENFLKWKKEFKIYDKTVCSIDVSSSGGADVIITFNDGTNQKLELEHKWNNYILHGHYKSIAWKDAWLYADEPFDFELIKKIFSPYIKEYINFIPKVYLCINSITKEKEAYEVDWINMSYKQLDIE